MRLTELGGKEIVNLYNGSRLGSIGDSDLLIDPEKGDIEAIILPKRTNFLTFWLEPREMEIPWQTVKKIGNEVVIVELDQTYANYKLPGKKINSR